TLPALDEALRSLPDDQLGIYLYAWWTVLQAEKLGISQEQITPEIAERLRVKALSLDTISEDYAGLEKALQLAAGAVGGGDLARGGQMFRQYMRRMARNVALVDEAKTGRRRQKVIASRPRPDDLNSLIFEIVKQRGGSIS